MLVLVESDTLETYAKNKATRLRTAAFLIAPIYLTLFLLMNFRFTRTCYRTIDVPGKDEIDIRTHMHFAMLFFVKLICLVCLLACFFKMSSN